MHEEFCGTTKLPAPQCQHRSSWQACTSSAHSQQEGQQLYLQGLQAAIIQVQTLPVGQQAAGALPNGTAAVQA